MSKLNESGLKLDEAVLMEDLSKMSIIILVLSQIQCSKVSYEVPLTGAITPEQSVAIE